MSPFAARHVMTTLKCPDCQKSLEITRSCHEAHMRCPACGKNYPLKDFIPKADKAMEEFLENLYCDRI